MIDIEKIVITIMAIVVLLTIIVLIGEKSTELKDKMYKAMTILIYIIIAIILILIAIKILFWAGILTASKA
ncbi:MAG: hypothetical protein NC485_11600 [Ruminococcus flavefaciens]|nr:hypothetical protein [Ruminococcus flavefaciens]